MHYLNVYHLLLMIFECLIYSHYLLANGRTHSAVDWFAIRQKNERNNFENRNERTIFVLILMANTGTWPPYDELNSI